jgi:two-component system sensor histidine kinase UhpB
MAAKRILIVEDEPEIAQLIRQFLEKSGYEVAATAATGEEALAQAERLQPDLALMDISLRGKLDGVQTAEQVFTRFGIPVVFVTGHADDATIERSQVARAFGYVLKPFRQEDIKSSIDLAFTKHGDESRLRRIEQSFGAAIKSIGDGVIAADRQGAVTFLNPVAEMLTGWRLAEAQGRRLNEVFPAPGPSLNLPRCHEPGSGASVPPASAGVPPALLFAGETPAVTAETAAPLPRLNFLVARDGTCRPIECTAAPIRNDAGEIIGQVVVFRDISERRQREEDLNRSRDQLRLLAAHLQGVREEERTRIAREVHDQLGQMLTGLRMDTAWIEKRLETLGDPAARAPLGVKLTSMFALLDQMVKTVRRISAELRPGVLDDLGLVPAMEWQAREWQERTGIECAVSSELDSLRIAPEPGTALFRIFQESLTNIARHAGATQVAARLGVEAGAIVLEICDNGRGVTADEVRNSKSLGLLGMRERAKMLGGEFRIAGKPARGTTVTVRIPYP